ncbi:MAG: cytochrome P450 [Myxococcota bacterium]|nr:cytochrome P450 [Myxococcota bacterium]
MQLSEIDLSPDHFVDDVPRDMFEVLRREAPVYHHPEIEGSNGDFWVVTKYDDIKRASKNHALFSSARRSTTLNVPDDEEALARVRAIMLNMDPPQHRRFRSIVNKAFTPRMVQRLLPSVRRMARQIVNGVCEKGECEFVDDVAALLPLEVICEMVGVPESDRPDLYDISNRLIGFDDPEYRTTEEDGQLAAAELFGYASQLAERARKHPGDDLATALIQAEVDGERLSELEFNSFFLLLIVAGNETTRTVTANGMYYLITHPDQRQLVADDLSLLPTAIEEILRHNPPVHYFVRTVMRDTELRGVTLREGERITMWYPSANRDEDVFERPAEFDVRRSPNEHIAFGVGEHYCLGANLARMELRVIFDELLRRVPDMELAAPRRRLRSNFINGVKEMRVCFAPSAPVD